MIKKSPRTKRDLLRGFNTKEAAQQVREALNNKVPDAMVASGTMFSEEANNRVVDSAEATPKETCPSGN